MDITHCLFICLYENHDCMPSGAGGTQHSWLLISPIIFLTEMRYIFPFTLKRGFYVEWSHCIPNPHEILINLVALRSKATEFSWSRTKPTCGECGKAPEEPARGWNLPPGDGLELPGAQWQSATHFNELPATLHFPSCHPCLILHI